jgi:hypothetical protein
MKQEPKVSRVVQLNFSPFSDYSYNNKIPSNTVDMASSKTV